MTTFTTLSNDDAERLGHVVRTATDDNLLVGSFAAELVGESYPFSTAMAAIVFKDHSDGDLGRKFAAFCDGDGLKALLSH